MKKIILILTLAFSSSAFSCPDLRGEFTCPSWKGQVGFDLKVSQDIKKGGVVLYSFKKTYINSDGLKATHTDKIAGYGENSRHAPPPVPAYIDSKGFYGRCDGKILNVKDTINSINSLGNLEASFDGKIASICKRK